jgi:diguanylate cyclase (GGDEF)-like protein/PAS domain S-box-containing protein
MTPRRRDRQQLDRALERAHARFRTLVQCSTDVVLVASDDGTIDYASPAIEAVLGYLPDEARGARLGDLFADPVDAKAQWQTLRRGTLTAPVHGEVELRHRDGSIRICEVTVRDLRDDPNVEGVVVNARDVTARVDAERERERQAEWFTALLRNQKDIVTVVGLDGLVHFISPNIERVLGFPAEEMAGTNGMANIHPDDLDVLVASLTEQLAGGTESAPVEYRQRTADGSWIWLEATASAVDPALGMEGVVVNSRDISERKRAETAQREAEAEFRNAFVHSPVGIGFADLSGRFTWVNRALSRIVGIPSDVLVGSRVQDLSRPEELAFEIAQTARLLDGEIGSFVSEKRYDHPDGRTLWALLYVSLVREASGAPKQLLGQVEDITERKRRELQHAHDAEHDPLTGLWNRAGLRRLMDDAWDFRLADEPLALIFGDLDGFKAVNDTYGHDAGDDVLVHVGQRLRTALRGGDQVARWGGDEFVVLCPGVRDREEATEIAGRLRETISSPFRIGHGHVTLGISLGVALDAHHHSPDDLLREADRQAYEAKQHGPNRVAISA